MLKGDFDSYQRRPILAKAIIDNFEAKFDARVVTLVATGISYEDARKQARLETPKEREHVKNMKSRLAKRDRKIVDLMAKDNVDRAEASFRVDQADYNRDRKKEKQHLRLAAAATSEV